MKTTFKIPSEIRVKLETNILDYWINEFHSSKKYSIKSKSGLEINLRQFLIDVVGGLGYDFINTEAINEKIKI